MKDSVFILFVMSSSLFLSTLLLCFIFDDGERKWRFYTCAWMNVLSMLLLSASCAIESELAPGSYMRILRTGPS
jgi:hypothetical protein